MSHYIALFGELFLEKAMDLYVMMIMMMRHKAVK